MSTRVSATIKQAAIIDLYVLDCPDCGVVFGITTDMEKRRRKDGANFYCPNGHHMAWTESEADRLKKEIAAKQSSLDWYSQRLQREQEAKEAAENSLRTTKGHLTRLKRRAEAGVCIHCNRTFQALARHMSSKHGEVSNGA